MTEAKLHKNKQGVVAITGPQVQEVKEGGVLTVNGLPLLLVRGGDTENLAGEIFRGFANHTDETGGNFTFSRKLRGVCCKDPLWGNLRRVTIPEIEAYVKKWFVLAELVSSGGTEAIVIVDTLPRMAIALLTQDRFVKFAADILPWSAE